MKGRQDMLEREVDKLAVQVQSVDEKFVTMKHFEAVIQPMQKRIDQVGEDTKEILRIVRGRHGEN